MSRLLHRETRLKTKEVLSEDRNMQQLQEGSMKVSHHELLLKMNFPYCKSTFTYFKVYIKALFNLQHLKKKKKNKENKKVSS